MKTNKKRNGTPRAGLLASLMNRAGVSPFGDAKYLRGFSLTCREELKAISGSEFMQRGAIVIPLLPAQEGDFLNTLPTVATRTCCQGDWLETFWIGDAGEIVRRPAKKYEGNHNPVDYAMWQNGRGVGLMDKVACIVVPGQVFAEVRLNFGPYFFVGTKVEGSEYLEFTRISLPVATDKTVLTWFRQLYTTYDKHVF